MFKLLFAGHLPAVQCLDTGDASRRTEWPVDKPGFHVYISPYDELWKSGEAGSVRPATKLFSALSDENRMRLVFALRHGELCVCQLIDLLGLAPSTVSKHLSVLRDAGLVDARKNGRWVYYRLANRPDFPVFGKRAPKLFQALETSLQVKSDNKKLKKICREDMDVVCQRQQERKQK